MRERGKKKRGETNGHGIQTRRRRVEKDGEGRRQRREITSFPLPFWRERVVSVASQVSSTSKEEALCLSL